MNDVCFGALDLLVVLLPPFEVPVIFALLLSLLSVGVGVLLPVGLGVLLEGEFWGVGVGVGVA